jgi:hypothetical protein
MIDNASSQAVAQFAEPDAVEENLRVGGLERLALNLRWVMLHGTWHTE